MDIRLGERQEVFAMGRVTDTCEEKCRLESKGLHSTISSFCF